MKNKLLVFLMLLGTSFAFSQYTLDNGANGTVSVCSGTFLDNGGSGNYSSSVDGTITFCPPTPGDLIKISFTSFSTEDDGLGGCYDYLDFWNGSTVGGAGTQDIRFCGVLSPFEITSTSPDGCVSFRFQSDFFTTSSGWSATITCVTPCTPPVAVLTDSSTVDICNPNADNPGSLLVAFDATGSTAASGQNILNYDWSFGDGTYATTATATTTHTYPSNAGVYIASVTVRDDNTVQSPLGCSSVNSTSKLIRVMPEPDFSATPSSYNINCGDSVTLTGIVSSQTETQEPPALVPATVALPDGTGVSFSSPIDFNGFFASGATMAPGCYPTVSFDLEHSASQDLEIKLISPNGQEVVLYNRGGHATEFTGFGTCANAADDSVPGCIATYSVVGDNSGVVWDAAASQTTATVTCPDFAGPCENPGFFGGYYYVPTTYNSDAPFSSLDGADLNGVWTLEITDHEINDDGVLKTWALDFPQSCYSLETVTPDLTTATWTGGGPALPVQSTTSSSVTDPGPDTCPTPGTCTGNELTNSPSVGPFMTAGTSTYTLTIVDEFGCEYHKDVTVTASCNCSITLDTANNTQTLCEDATLADIVYTLGGDATGATVTGLPTGVTGTYLGGVFTISGTPTTAVGSPFNYTVTTIGCTPNLSETGTITVTAKVDPIFTQVAPICDGDALAPLPTTSNNGIDGTWSPALDNTATTTYTFTPDAGECANSQTMTITVNAIPDVPTLNNAAATCTADGTSTISNYDGTIIYTFTPAGPTVGAGGVISGMVLETSYTVNANNGSCSSDESVSFTNATSLAITETPVASVTEHPSCTNQYGTIEVTSPTLATNEEYVLDGPDATGTVQTNSTDGIFTNLDSGDYTLYISNTNTGCVSNSIILTVNDIVLIPSFTLSSGCNSLDYVISVDSPNSSYTYNWYNSIGTLIGSGNEMIVTQADTYEVQATMGTCITSEFITIDNAICSIPKGLSPNGDGLNDTWNLSNLDVQQVKIYNRYGTELYSKVNYTNEWDGTSDKGNELPSATYYYVVWFNNDTTKTGWVYLNR
jgi:gliding motility-associated-like protein